MIEIDSHLICHALVGKDGPDSDSDPDFAKNVKLGDIIVAGRNFGCGSSREQAATCLKYAGVQAVIAKSFARIFFRNAINQGLPVIQSDDAVEDIGNGEEIEIDFALGKIKTSKREYAFPPPPDSVLGILEAGGLISYTKKKLMSSEFRVRGSEIKKS